MNTSQGLSSSHTLWNIQNNHVTLNYPLTYPPTIIKNVWPWKEEQEALVKRVKRQWWSETIRICLERKHNVKVKMACRGGVK